MNTKCKWKMFQNVGESQPRGVKGVDCTSRYHLCKICWKNDYVQLYVNFSNSTNTIPKSHMHIFNVSIVAVQGLKNVSRKV
jgi:hypothetical protein